MATAFRLVITNPNVLKQYTQYINAYRRRKLTNEEKTAIHTKTEKTLARIMKATARGGSKRLIPDFRFRDTDVLRALRKVTGKDITELEAKLKRSTTSKNTKTTIGAVTATSSLVAALKEELVNNEESEILDIDLLHSMSRKLNANQGKILFEALAKDTLLGAEFYRKSSTLQIFKKISDSPNAAISGLEVITFSFSKSNFTNPPFGAKFNKADSRISVFLQDSLERQVVNALRNIGNEVQIANNKQFAEGLNKLTQSKTFSASNLKGSFDFSLLYAVPTGGSMPVSKGKIVSTKKNKKPKRGQFISGVQLTTILQSRMRREMPKGPIGGKPLSDKVLTIRTGRYLDSTRVIVNFRNNLIRYFYNPLYSVHNTTNRSPDDQIEENIRQITQRQFGRQFKILRGF